FLQTKDGIRYGHVTGVQTCALPISHETLDIGHAIEIYELLVPHYQGDLTQVIDQGLRMGLYLHTRMYDDILQAAKALPVDYHPEIGRASCREIQVYWVETICLSHMQ